MNRKFYMRAYIIRRLLLVIPTLFLASLVIFFIMRLIPGDVIDMMTSQMNQFETPVARAYIEHALGLDAPVITQYGRWLSNIILHGDFGVSIWKQIPVTEEIMARWPVTITLGLLGIIIAQIIALPIGVFSALRQDTWGDYIARSFAIFCIAVPGFWIATLVIVFPSIWWGWSPPIVYTPFTEDPIANLQMLIIPAIVLGMLMSGTTMRMTRSMMLEVLRQDYIRTAWAKGLRERVIVIRHALKNALIPVITLIGLQVPILVGGAVVIEQIFCLPGLGRFMLQSIQYRDYPVVSGVMLLFGAAMVLSNLIVDLTYAYLDPRVRYK